MLNQQSFHQLLQARPVSQKQTFLLFFGADFSQVRCQFCQSLTELQVISLPPVMLFRKTDVNISNKLLRYNNNNNNNTRLTALCLELPGWANTRKVKAIWIYWSKKQWVAVASAGPSNLHLTIAWQSRLKLVNESQVRCATTRLLSYLQRDKYTLTIAESSYILYMYLSVEIQ